MKISDSMVSVFVGLACWVGIMVVITPNRASLIAFYAISVLAIGVLVTSLVLTIRESLRVRREQALDAMFQERELARHYHAKYYGDKNSISDAEVPTPPPYLKRQDAKAQNKSPTKKSLEQINDELEV